MRRKMLIIGLVLVAAAASPQAARKTYPPGGAGGGAPADAEYVVTEANGTLSAEVAPGADDQVPSSDSATSGSWKTLPNGAVSYATGSNTFSQAGISNLASSTSGDLRTVLSDETGTGAAMFGITTSMTDDISCTANQVLRRNAGDTAWECATVSVGGWTLREADTSPSVSNVTLLEVDQADGFTVTDETGGQAQIDLVAATASQAGGVSTAAQTFGGDKTFNNDVSVGEQFLLPGDTSPAQLTGDQNDYAGCGTAASICRLSVDSTARDITGMTGGADGRVLTVMNTTTAGFIYLVDEWHSTASTAANRFDFGQRNCLLGQGDAITLIYDSTASRWKDAYGSSHCSNINVLARRHLWTYAPCFSSASGQDDSMWDQTANGTGAAMNVPLASTHCYMTINLGTTTTGRVSATTHLTGSLYFGSGWWSTFGAVVTGTALSDGTDDYIYYWGALDSVTAEPTDGCFLKYNDGVNSGKWQGVCTNNSTPSTCDTGVTVATSTGYLLGMAVNEAGTSVTFYVNRTSTCSVNSNIPTTSARAFALGYSFRKTAGTTARSWFQGPMFYRLDPSAPSQLF